MNLYGVVRDLTEQLKPVWDQQSDEFRHYYISQSAGQQSRGSYPYIGVFVKHKANLTLWKKASNAVNTVNSEFGHVLPVKSTARFSGLVLQVIDQDAKDKTWIKTDAGYQRVSRQIPIKVSPISYQKILDMRGDYSTSELIMPIPMYASQNGLTVLYNNPFYLDQAKKVFDKQSIEGGVEYLRVPWLSSRVGLQVEQNSNSKPAE